MQQQDVEINEPEFVIDQFGEKRTILFYASRNNSILPERLPVVDIVDAYEASDGEAMCCLVVPYNYYKPDKGSFIEKKINVWETQSNIERK